jgi:hypothetical protein
LNDLATIAAVAKCGGITRSAALNTLEAMKSFDSYAEAPDAGAFEVAYDDAPNGGSRPAVTSRRQGSSLLA